MLAQQATAPTAETQEPLTLDIQNVNSLGTGGAFESRYVRGTSGLGPFDLPSQSPLQLPRVGISPLVPSSIAKGQWEIGSRESLTNMWAQKDGEYRLDYGSLMSSLSVAYGLTDDIRLEIEFQDHSRFSSILDPITDVFHDLFGLDDSGRDDYPERDNFIGFDVQGIEIEESGTVRSNVALTVQQTFYESQSTAFSWALTYRDNVYAKSFAAGEGENSYGLSFGFSHHASKDSKHYTFGSVGLVVHEEDNWFGQDLAKEQVMLLLGYERHYSPSASFIVQYLVMEGVAREIEPFDEASHEFVLGIKKEFSGGTMLEFGVIENAVVADNSPDFGLHFGLTHRF